MRINFKWVFALAFLVAGVAEAETYNLPNNPKSSWGCIPLNGSTVTCNNFNLNNADQVTVTGNITLRVNGSASVQNAKINVGGGANNLTIDITGNLTSDTGVKIEANIIASAGKVTLGYNGTLIGNITANSATFGGENSITGSVSVSTSVSTTGSNVAISGGIEADNIALGNGSSVGGPINAIDLTTGSNVLLSNITAATVTLGSNNTVNGQINATNKVTTGSNTQLIGNINTPSVTLGSANTVNGNLDAVNITVSPSNSVVNGNLNASNNINLGSGTHISGNISAGGHITTTSPVTLAGDISAGGDFNLASGSTVLGNIDADNITMAPSSSTVTGELSAVNKVILGSGNTVVGDVYGKTITLESSTGRIEGNATATEIVTINWHGVITGNVTAPHIENNGGTIIGDIFCDTRNGLIRECNTDSGGNSGDNTGGLASCTGFNEMIGSGVIGGTNGNPNFSYGSGSTINGLPITGSGGNSPTPNGQVAVVPTNFPSLDPEIFPSNSNFGGPGQKNIQGIPPGSYGTIRTTENGSTSTSGGGTYYINKLSLEEKSSITLGSGDYFIKAVELKEKSEIIIVPGAKVRILIAPDGEFEVDEKVEINKYGEVSGLAIYLYADAEFAMEEKGYFKGLIYSPFTDTEIEFDEESTVEGAIISAGKVELEDKVSVIFTEDTLLGASEAAGCEANLNDNFGQLSSCSDFEDLSINGILGNSGFTYRLPLPLLGSRSKINRHNITGSNGNSPNPNSGSVHSVPVTFPTFAPAGFPHDKMGTGHILNQSNITPGSYGTIATGSLVGIAPPFTSTTGGGTYYIENLNLRGSILVPPRVDLGPGDYFISNINVDDNASINIVGNGLVRIFIGTKFDADNRVDINKYGDVKNLAIYLYDNTKFDIGRSFTTNVGGSSIKGLIYSPYENTEVQFGRRTDIEGAVLTAGTIDLHHSSNITFTNDTHQEVLEAMSCDASSTEPVVDHYRILNPPSQVSCMAAPVTIQACANASCTALYPGVVTTNISSSNPAAHWNGTTANTAGITFSNGEATVGLSLVAGGQTTLSLNNFFPTAINNNFIQCNGSGGNIAPNCNIEFKTAGLMITNVDGSQPINSPFAGSDFELAIRAVETDLATGACLARVSGNRPVQLAVECTNPTSCVSGQTFEVNEQSIFANNAPISLNFDENDPEHKAVFTANYSDVGQLQLHASLDLPSAPTVDPNVTDPATTLTGSGSFVVRPHKLIVQGLDDNDNPWIATADSYKAAGEPFKVAIQSLNANGVITPNFGQETTPTGGTVAFHTVQFPAGGFGLASHLEINSPFTNIDAPLGALISSGAIWNEAGTVNLTAALNNNSYLGAGDAFERPASPVGRFYPHHFVVASSLVSNSCEADSFSYLGQPKIGINFTLHALNAGGSLVKNYGHENYAGVAAIGAAAIDTANNLPAGRLIADVSATWVDGIYDVTLSDAEVTRRADNEPDGPFENVEVHIEITNAEDSRAFLNGVDEALSGELHLKYGRMVLENIYGPEDVQLNVQLNTEYWNGERFVPHSLDNCTPFEHDTHDNTVGLSVVADPDLLNPTAADSAGLIIKGAVATGSLYWLPPSGTNQRGEFEFEFEYNAPEWLRFDWGRTGAVGSNENPQATGGFGQYRGNDRVIFSLERNL